MPDMSLKGVLEVDVVRVRDAKLCYRQASWQGTSLKRRSEKNVRGTCLCNREDLCFEEQSPIPSSEIISCLR